MTVSTAVISSARARTIGIKTEQRNLSGSRPLLLPQRLALVGQGDSNIVYSTDKKQVTSASEAGSIYGFGSPIHRACMRLLPQNGDGIGTVPVTVYPLVSDSAGQASSSELTITGTQTETAVYQAVVNGEYSEFFSITADDTILSIVQKIAEAINANINMPIRAIANVSKVDLVAKWRGESGNDLNCHIEGSTTAGIVFAITDFSGGLANPNIQSALDKIGNIWETALLNCANIEDTATLDKIETFGRGRWGALTYKPLVAFTGNTKADDDDAISVSDSRPDDFINSQLVAPGSENLPFEVAARQLAKILPEADSAPARDFGKIEVTEISPGSDEEQWNYATRDKAMKAGSSTITVEDTLIHIEDIVTFYHPQGQQDPLYRYVVDIFKLQNIIYNLDSVYNNREWSGAPLVPDFQNVKEPSAKKPKMAKARIFQTIDNLGDYALISDPDYSKANTTVTLSGTNSKRLDTCVPVKLSGNGNIYSIDLKADQYYNI